jgi:acyl-CoA thioesterase
MKKDGIAFVGAFQSLTLPMKKTVEISLLGMRFLLYFARLALVHYSNRNASLWFYALWVFLVFNHLVWFLVLFNLTEWDAKLCRIATPRANQQAGQSSVTPSRS